MSAPTRFDVTLLGSNAVRVRVFERRGCVYLPLEEVTVTGDRASAVLGASLAIAAVLAAADAPRELLEGMEAIAEIATEATHGT